jgi:hypothetical protein
MNIQLYSSLPIYMKLFQYIDYLSYKNEVIFIQNNTKYNNELNTLFSNYQNIIFYEDEIDNLNLKKYNIQYLKNNKDILSDLKKIFNISEKYQESILYRNKIEENKLYNYFIENINQKYVFFYNKKNSKIINYFENTYVFQLQQNFYDINHPYYDKWKKIHLLNYTYLFSIIEHALELHIYDEDFLFLILEANISHIKNKYFYCSNIEIKQLDDKLKEWNFIYV